jgi:hypothetical protein
MVDSISAVLKTPLPGADGQKGLRLSQVAEGKNMTNR